MPCEFKQLSIPDVILIQPAILRDSRGFFAETYKLSEFKDHGIDVAFIQDNHAVSHAGVIRGLHFQKTPYAQGKLVRVVRGKILDVAVDIRRHSPTYGQWVSAILSDENHQMMWIPAGFAHGLCVLTDNTHVLYKVSGSEYHKDADRSIAWNDPEINIEWPIKEPVLSIKDSHAPLLKECDHA